MKSPKARICGDARRVADILGLKPLEPEGGFYRETYRSRESILPRALSGRYAGGRAAGTAIYYLLTAESFSVLHRLKSDEIYHFYLGDPVELFTISPGGRAALSVLGGNLRLGMRPQALVPRGHWQGAKLTPGGKYALLGTTVAPGFDLRDFEMGRRDRLILRYPQHRRRIIALTQKNPA